MKKKTEQLEKNAKPFLKWAGGKTKLIPEISKRLPKLDNITYIEPFIGGGSLMFYIAQNFNIKEAIINDINIDVISCYNSIKSEPENLIKKLSNLEEQFHNLETVQEKTDFYSDIRNKFNLKNLNTLDNATLMIFLNKTCFNGLYRVNKKNQFNVPFNKVLKPTICDEENIMNCHKLLQKVTILNGDYSETLKYSNEDSFFYFDPPYKPISETASFNSYNKESFEDLEQKKLCDFCKLIDSKGGKWLLSNSDMKNVDETNNFFDDMYSDFNIQRIKSKRMINSKGDNRGEIDEVLISNS